MVQHQLKKMKWQRLLSLLLLFILTANLLQAQTPSGQAKFVSPTPTVLSGCNNDSIAIQVCNFEGPVCPDPLSPANLARVEVDVPGGALVNYVSGSLQAPGQFVSYSGKKLIFNVPMPAYGQCVTVKFLVFSECNVNTLSPLPQFNALIDYPAAFPTANETFNSGALNTGVAQISHYGWSNDWLNPAPAFGTQFRIITATKNIGYGEADEITYTAVDDTAMKSVIMYPHLYNPDGTFLGNFPATPISTTTVDGGKRIQRTWKVTPSSFPAYSNNILQPGWMIRWDRYMTPPSRCDQFQSRQWWDLNCANGTSTNCQPNDTLYSTINLAAGTPNMVSTLYQADDMDGCPNKHIKYTMQNRGTGNAAPVGNAYDVKPIISLGGGLITMSNLRFNGIAVPPSLVTPNPSLVNGSSFTVNLKDQNTNSFGGAFNDLDGDGFFDDMKGGGMTGDSVVIEFDYTVPCEEACGANLFYTLSGRATYTDFCRTLNGNTGTQLKQFGFQQVKAIEQTKKVEFGTLTSGQSKTDTARFQFQYKAFNVDVSAATVKLRINYNKKMEVNPNYILFNNAPFTNAPVLVGTGVTFGAPTPGVSDNDSAYEVDLTAAEIAALFDNAPDSIIWEQTFYGCDIRQNQNNGDNFQLLVRMKPGLCSDGSTPCTFDLACKKPWSYNSATSCGPKPCYQGSATIMRSNPIGWTNVNETSTIAPNEDKTRMYEGDTMTLRTTSYINGFVNMEPNGYYVNLNQDNRDLLQHFSFTYSTPKGFTNTPLAPFIFLPNISTVKIYQRTPNPSNANTPGTIGALITTAPILVEDFLTDAGANNAVPGNENQWQGGYNARGGSYGSVQYGEGWYCNNGYTNDWSFFGICPAKDGFYRNTNSTINYIIRQNEDENKLNAAFYLSIGGALNRIGWHGNPGDTSYYYEIDIKWRANPAYPWDNSNDFTASALGLYHYGNLNNVDYYSPASTDNRSCGTWRENGLVVTKEWKVNNPNSAYSANCGLTVCHDIFFKSYEGNYFRNGEVRVPYKIDSIVATLPSEYAIVGAPSLQYNQGGVLNAYGGITASAATGTIKFTNGSSDFPRTDDEAGNKLGHKLCYTIAKVGSAAPTTYRQSVKIYTKDEFGNSVVLADSFFIVEANPILTVTALNSPVQNDDGGACTPGYVDFEIQNNTLFDAPNTYFAAETNATRIYNLTDGGYLYSDPIDVTDTSRYSTTNLFGKLGTIKAGDRRTVRVYFNTTSCTGAITVYTDWGCNYPAGLTPVATATRKTATANYTAKSPNILSLPVGGSLQVANLCDKQWVEIEVKNSNNANLYNIVASAKLPANATIVPGTAQLSVSRNIGGNAAVTAGSPATITPAQFTAGYVALSNADVTISGTDSITMNLSASAPLSRICGLPGADEAPNNTIRFRFQIDFTACPASATETIIYTVSGTNYCGTPTSTQGAININYVGSGSTPNNFTAAAKSEKIYLCAGIGETQTITDTITITNIGGYTGSGATSGLDSVTITIPGNSAIATLSNITVGAPFTGAVVGTNAQGLTTITAAIPAGIAVNGTVKMPISYTLTPVVANACSALASGNCSGLSYVAQFTSPISLGCAAKGLTCNSLSKVNRGVISMSKTIECCGTLGNYVWKDDNNDGLQNEPAANGINGVKVYLWKESAPGSGVYVKVDSTVTTNDGSGNPGYYKFTGIVEANYKVQFPTTVGAMPISTPNNQASTTDGNNDADAPGFSGVVPMNPSLGGTSKDNMTIDAGYKGNIGSIGNYVWKDDNGDGLQNEPAANGINGVKVYLYKETAPGVFTIVDSTVTANDGSGNPGYYNFPNLVSGNYQIGFPTQIGDKSLTTPNSAAGTDGNSDPNQTTGRSPLVSINPYSANPIDVNNNTIDAGYAPLGKIGNFVWYDADKNGLQNEPASSGINGVKVYLYKETAPGVYTVVDSTVTANDGMGNPGYYLFENLNSGNYKVGFPTTANSWGLTTANGTAAADGNSDANQATGLSPVVTINVSSPNPTDRYNYTIDAGYICITSAGADKFFECGMQPSSTTVTGTPTGGTWTAVPGNPSGGTIGTTTGGVATISGLPTAPTQGTWKYVYTTPNGCTDTMNVVIGVTGNPNPALNGGTNPICKNGTVQYCPTVWGWANYQWYKNGVPVAAPKGTGACITLDSTEVGTYTLRATNGAGCWSNLSAPIVVTYDNTCTAGSGSVTGGGTGGVETKTLGNVIANRLFGNALNSRSQELLATAGYTKSTAVVNGPADLKLSDLVPATVAGTDRALISTPADLVNFTNALEVLSVDYKKSTVNKAVAFGTRTAGEVYSHTKPICDRLKGAELLEVKTINISGYNVMAYQVRQRTGEVEYAINLHAGVKAGRSSISVQSNWFTDSYVADETMFNFQLWAVSYDMVSTMAKDIITKLQQTGTVQTVTSTDLPRAYVSKGNRAGTKVNVTIQNNTSNTTGYFEIREKQNEGSVETVRTVPFTIGANKATSVEIPVQDYYEGSMYMYVNNKLTDLLYLSDGTWSVDYNKNNTTITKFEVQNETNPQEQTGEYRLMRNVEVTGTSKDYISVYKTINGGGIEQNLSNYKGIKFTTDATGLGQLKVTIVKKGIQNWADQYSYTLNLDGTSKEYQIGLSQFKSSKTPSTPINANDVLAVNFGYNNTRGGNTSATINLSKVRFTTVDVAAQQALQSKQVSVYPNPIQEHRFTASFTSETEETVVLRVVELATGKTVKLQFVEAKKGKNQVQVQLDKATNNGMYSVQVQGDGGAYETQKVMVNRK
jgi:hypothetical protein